MPFALIILEHPGQRQRRTEAEGRELYDRMLAFSDELARRGLLTLAQSLKGDEAAVRVSGTRPTVVDGPFAESKEMIGGIFLLRCKAREQAVEIAKACPAVSWATVEVRELGPCFT